MYLYIKWKELMYTTGRNKNDLPGFTANEQWARLQFPFYHWGSCWLPPSIVQWLMFPHLNLHIMVATLCLPKERTNCLLLIPPSIRQSNRLFPGILRYVSSLIQALVVGKCSKWVLIGKIWRQEFIKVILPTRKF
jgi:hypothetical protein